MQSVEYWAASHLSKPHTFGCLRLHSARASSNCAFHGSGVTLTRGSLKPRTILPNLISSSSDIWRRRSRSFWSCFSSDSKAIEMPVSRQRKDGFNIQQCLGPKRD
jgi:hypothetical protein